MVVDNYQDYLNKNTNHFNNNTNCHTSPNTQSNKQLINATTNLPVYKLTCRLLNARSLCNKLIDFRDLLSTERLDIAAVTETWLNDSIPDSLIVDENSNFFIFRKDRLTHVGGGFFLVTNDKTVTTVPVHVPDIFSDLEIITIDILNSTPPTRVITCYSPPPLTSSSQDNFDYMTRLTTCLDILSGVNASIII